MDAIQLEKLSSTLSCFVEEFADVFGWKKRVNHCKTYLSGLLLDGERKSIDPISSRLQGSDNQALQQFVNQSPWDGFELQLKLRQYMVKRFRIKESVYVLDDTTLPKKGKHSVGVARQYCGALGKIANCQTVVSLEAVNERSHFPLAARLYLPESWTDDSDQMESAGIPPEYQQFKTKPDIALELLDECMPDLTISTFLFDAGYGRDRNFLKALDDREIKFVGGLKGDETFWAKDIRLKPTGVKTGGRHQKHIIPVEKDAKALTTKQWAEELFSDRKNIRTTAVPLKKPILVEYVAVRVYEVGRRPRRHLGPERWLVIERLADGSFKYYSSNYDEKTSPEKIIYLAHKRYNIEQTYQQLKEELGLDHFEGRSWNGLHHHIALCFMAYNFLQTLIRQQGKGKKKIFQPFLK